MSLKEKNRLKTKIKILMLEKGVSQAGIARKLGISRSAVNHVINGRVESDRIKKAIAKGLRMSYKKVWDN